MLNPEVVGVVPSTFADAGPDLRTTWIAKRMIVWLAAGATLLALGALVQVLENHSGGASPQNFFYADAGIEATAYGCIAASLFVGWGFSGRSGFIKDFSFPLMLAFLGAACVVVQWIMVLLDYVEQFSLRGSNPGAIKHLVDASALLQLLGWGAIAAALVLTLRVLLVRGKHESSLSEDMQLWHLGPIRAPRDV